MKLITKNVMIEFLINIPIKLFAWWIQFMGVLGNLVVHNIITKFGNR
jgi:hypothetical protein